MQSEGKKGRKRSIRRLILMNTGSDTTTFFNLTFTSPVVDSSLISFLLLSSSRVLLMKEDVKKLSRRYGEELGRGSEREKRSTHSTDSGSVDAFITIPYGTFFSPSGQKVVTRSPELSFTPSLFLE